MLMSRNSVRGYMKAQREHKGRQSSEARRKALLAQIHEVLAEAEKIEAPVQQVEALEKLKQDVISACMDVRKHQDFLRGEHHQLEAAQKKLASLKETRRKEFLDQFKTSIFLILFAFVPIIFIAKVHYLSLAPKNLPVSSSLLYMTIGDILFYTWVILCIFYAAAYRYITIHYIDPLLARNPSRFFRLSTKLLIFSLFGLFYQYFLLYSSSIVPTLISPSWGPSLANILSLLISWLTSSPINAVIAVISITPAVGSLFKKYRKHKLFPFWGRAT